MRLKSYLTSSQHIVKDKFTVVDSFYYEGDISYFENSKADEIKVEWES